jgi:hypothetical protein
MELIMSNELSNYKDYMIESLFSELDNFNLITEASSNTGDKKNVFRTVIEKIGRVIKLLKDKIIEIIKKIKGIFKKDQDQKTLSILKKEKLNSNQIYIDNIFQNYIKYDYIITRRNKLTSNAIDDLIKTIDYCSTKVSSDINDMKLLEKKLEQSIDHEHDYIAQNRDLLYTIENNDIKDLSNYRESDNIYAYEIFEFSIKNIEEAQKELLKNTDYLNKFEKSRDKLYQLMYKKGDENRDDDDKFDDYVRLVRNITLSMNLAMNNIKSELNFSTDLYDFYRNVIKETYYYIYKEENPQIYNNKVKTLQDNN